MKSKFAQVLDNIFLAIVVWLLSAVIALYFIERLYVVVLVATAITLGGAMLLRIRNKKTKAVRRDKYNAQLLEQHFLFNDDRYALDYLYNALSSRYKVKKHNYYLIINQTLIVPNLTEPLSLKKAVFYYSEAVRKSAKTLVILTFKTEKFPVSLSEKFCDLRFEIFDYYKTYLLLKSLGFLPKTEKPLRRLNIKNFLQHALNPKRATSYLFSALILLFGAYFSVFSIYFIIMSSVCLTLALVSKINIIERLGSKKIHHQ